MLSFRSSVTDTSPTAIRRLNRPIFTFALALFSREIFFILSFAIRKPCMYICIITICGIFLLSTWKLAKFRLLQFLKSAFYWVNDLKKLGAVSGLIRVVVHTPYSTCITLIITRTPDKRLEVATHFSIFPNLVKRLTIVKVYWTIFLGILF